MVASKALKALANTEMTLFAQNRELTYLWVFNATDSWLDESVVGQGDADILDAGAAAKSVMVKNEVLRSHRPARFEY